MKNIWENPEIQSENRLPMRSPLLPYENELLALKEVVAGPVNCPKTKSSFYKDLDGEWQFQLLNNPEQKYSEKWNLIQVPGTWTLQGYDKPHYTNVQMPFDCIPPNVPEENPTGVYQKEVFFDKSWQNRRIVLHIGSAESVLIVSVNAQKIGMSKDSRLPCEFEISPYIEWSEKGGKAKIELKVIRYSDASFVEDQDQWWFGGIHRSVYAYSTEQIFISDVEALTTVKKESINQKFQTGKGIIPLVVTLGFSDFKNSITRRTNSELDGKSYLVKYTVHALEGSFDSLDAKKVVAQGEETCFLNLRDNLNQLRKEIIIENASLWSNEHPSLYAVSVSLYEINNQRHIESVCFTIGFKTTEIKNRELRFNDKMVYIHGVNRHEHNAYHGKTLTTQEMLHDIYLLKSHHFNAVRTCHYPDDERWYELCDRYGLYVLDEANIENHAYYDVFARSDEWFSAYSTRCQRMIRRDKNHACIFGWSLGNESGDGQNQVALSAWIRRVDPTRIVHYEGFVRAEWKQPWSTLDDLSRGKGLTDLISPMYPAIDLIVDYVKKYDDYRPIIMCEYSHAMGNANGSLSDYWNAIESNHGLQGGFIWDWIDQGIASDANISEQAKKIAEDRMKNFPKAQGGLYWKYGGDFGDRPCDYDFCINGLLLPDQTPKPAMEECRALFSPVRLKPIHAKQGIFEVENRFNFSDLSSLSLNWAVFSNGFEIAKGSICLPAIESGKKENIFLKQIPEILAKQNCSDEIYLRADFVYSKNYPWAQKNDLCSSCGIEIRSAFGIQKYQKKENDKLCSKEFIQNILDQKKMELCRAITENEGVKQEIPLIKTNPHLFSFEGKPSIQWLEKDLLHAQIDKNSIFTGPAYKSKEKLADFVYSVSPCTVLDGISAFNVDCVFTLTNSLAEYPRVGITFPIPASFNKVRWYGNGPHECYCDRTYSALKGMYELPCSDLEVPYIVPQENGERCNVKYLELFEENGNFLHLQSDIPFSFTLSKYTIENQFECLHLSELTDCTKSENPHWNLTIDCAHRGVGTAACGPDTLEQYRIRPGVYRLQFVIW